ncbi:hypothetical protein Tco_1424686, partial [Tanacetum coccineum]
MLLIAQKEEAGIQLQAKEFDLMTSAGDIEEIEVVNANFILMANLQQASTSGTQAEKAPVYDSDGSTELLESTTEPQPVQQNNSNVIFADSSMDHSRGIVEQHPATVDETRAYFESLYNNLVTKVEKVNTVNRKIRKTNADLTTELARYKGQEKCFEINQEKYDKLERCYKKSVYQEQCLTKKINALHLSSAKTIMALNEEITNLNNQLSKEKSTVSYLQKERKKLKNDLKTQEDELLDKLIESEKKIKELNNICTEKQQRLYNGKVLLEKHDRPAVYDSEETLQLAQKSQVAKFVRDFKSLAKEADESLDKNKVLEYESNRLLRVVVSQDILSIVQNNFVVDSSNLQNELE